MHRFEKWAILSRNGVEQNGEALVGSAAAAGRGRDGCRKDRLVGAAVLGETYVSKDEATCLGSYDPGCLGWLLEFQIGS